MLIELPDVGSASSTELTKKSFGGTRTMPASGVGMGTWSLCFVSFFGLELIEAIGTLAVVVFLAPWAVIIAPRHNQFRAAVIQNWPLLLLPGLAILSVSWSRDPLWSLRSSIEYLMTILVGIAAGNCVKRRTLLTALMMVLMIVNTAGVAYAFHRGLLAAGGGGSTGGYSGLFGSKNQLAGASAIQLLLALCFLFLDRNTIFSKMVYLAAIFIGLLGFYLGRSAGALVSLLVALSAILFLRLFKTNRLLMASIALMAVLAAGAVLSEIDAKDLFSSALSSLGKDKTLTGRTGLWKVALDQIVDLPFTGDGFSAFWRPGNPKAEVIWMQFGVPSKIGFHFHDTYLQAAVDLGIFGCLILIANIGMVFFRIINKAIASQNIINIATASILVFFVIWSFVELQFIVQFYLSALILCICSFSNSWVEE